ncbi:MAG: cytochrome c [Betaproteobacteria bacterium]|nr:cytochrome c [Betaproteobacteria bacterium]
MQHGSMHPRAALLVLALVAGSAAAQSAEDGLNDKQRHGRQLLAQNCGVCHLPVTRGAKTYGPVLNKAAASGNDELARAFILNGSGRMPAFKYHLKPAEVDDLVAYIRVVPEQKGD